MISILGVAGTPAAVELYGLNAAREVTMHGWFDQPAVFSMLSQRPPCLIAIDAGALSSDVVALLLERGHAVVIVPALAPKSRKKRSAKDVCRSVLGLAARSNPVAKTMH